MSFTNIVQWNCRGLRSNFNELQLLDQDLSPSVFCLQETYLKQTDTLNLRRYEAYHSFSHPGDRATGGSSILVKQNVIHSPITLTTNLQAVAVRLTLHIAFTICSLYVPPSSTLHLSDLQGLYDQLPKPCLIMGDLNGHNPLWGGTTTNAKGKILEDFISHNDLCIYNDDSSTYLHPATGTYSSLDLSLADSTLFNEFDWSVHNDLCGSDHFPTILSEIYPTDSPSYTRWNFSKADW